MARYIEQGKSIFIPFKDGYSIAGSQLHLRMYKTVEMFKRHFPKYTKYDELCEYAPVVHGHWEITEDDYLSLVELKCSVCGESYGFEDYEDCTPQNYHYCPNCGAKMDREPAEDDC